jgi:integrase
MAQLHDTHGKRIELDGISVYLRAEPIDKKKSNLHRWLAIDPAKPRAKQRKSLGRVCGTWSEPGSAEHLTACQRAKDWLEKEAARQKGIKHGLLAATGDASDIGFLAWWRDRIELDRAKNRNRCQSVYNYAAQVFPESLKLRDVKRGHFKELKELLLQNMSPESARNYLAWVKGQLNRAALDYELIPRNPWAGLSVAVGNYHQAPHKKRPLTLEQLHQLRRQPTRHPNALRAFFFGCATGAGLGDLLKLTHSNIERFADGSGQLTYVRAKTERNPMKATVPLSADTLRLIGPKQAPNAPLFTGLPSNVTIGNELKRLAAEAGLGRAVTFYECRHTFVALHLTKEKPTRYDLLRQMTGHASIKALMRYAQGLELEQGDTHALNLGL